MNRTDKAPMEAREKKRREKSRTSVRRAHGGFGDHAGLERMALIMIVIAIMVPVLMGVNRAIKHGMSFPVAIGRAFLALVSLVGFIVAALVLLALLALPVAWFVKVTQQKPEHFREVWEECWGQFIAVSWGLFVLTGLCLMIWDWIIVPVARFVSHR